MLIYSTGGCVVFKLKPFKDETDFKTQFVPRSKHSALVIKTNQLMLYRGVIAVCYEIHAKHIDALWAEHRISVC